MKFSLGSKSSNYTRGSGPFRYVHAFHNHMILHASFLGLLIFFSPNSTHFTQCAALILPILRNPLTSSSPFHNLSLHNHRKKSGKFATKNFGFCVST